MRRRFWLQALAGLVVLVTAALWHNLPRLAPGAFNWAEPGNIAAALVEGRGFSDPLGGGTGPTAWHPPAFPLLVAGVFAVTGVKTATSAAVLIALAVLGLAAAHALLIAAVPETDRLLRGAVSGVFLFLVAVLPGSFLDVLSEAWLAVLCSTLLLWGTIVHRRTPGRAATAALATGAAVGALTHAGLIVGAGALLAVLACLDLRARRMPRAAIVALATLVVGCSAWTVRNRVALGRWIPLKSNFWYELHLTTVVSRDGLLYSVEAMPRHPFFSQAEFDRYAKLGEVAYVDTFKEPALAAIRANPGDFVQRVGRRFVDAFGAIAPDETISLTRHAFNPADRARLANAGLLLPLPDVGALWLALTEGPDDVRGRIAALGLTDPSGSFRDWLEHRRLAAEKRDAWGGRFTRLLLSGLPVFALALAALIGGRRLAPIAGWAALLHFATLAPYVLVNHGSRQQFPQTALHAVFLAALPAAIVARRNATASV